MEIIFRKNHSYGYVCHTCGNQFNWDSKSWRWGKLEYRTVMEQKQDEKYFCSDTCKDEFTKTFKR